jgi:hypothetical protein
MTNNTQRQTAKIIQFPIERRAVRGNAQPVARRVVEPTPAVTVESSSGWYHDAAIQDAGTARHR